MSDDIEKAERELREAENKRFAAAQARKWRQSGRGLLLFTLVAPVLGFFCLYGAFRGWAGWGWFGFAWLLVCLGIFAIMDWRKKERQHRKWEGGQD